MDPQSNSPVRALTDMEIKARELSKARLLRAYLVVIKEITVDPQTGKPEPTVRTVCVNAPSWSHVAAQYDHPESGVEILKQEFLALGESYLLPLEQNAKIAEFKEDLSGLKMCYACANDFRNQPGGRCRLGHRVDTTPASTPCDGFRRK